MWEDTLFYSILVEQILTRAWASQSSVLDTSVPQKVTCSAVHSDAPFHSDGPFSLSSSSSGLCRISGLSCWSEILINFDLLWSIVFSYGEFSSRYGPYGLWRVRSMFGETRFFREILHTKARQNLWRVIELLRVGTHLPTPSAMRESIVQH